MKSRNIYSLLSQSILCSQVFMISRNDVRVWEWPTTKKWSLPLRAFLTFCAATIFTFEVFVIKKDYWTMVHSTSLYICQQIYHSVVKNGRVLFFSAYGSKNKSVKHYNTDYFWKISSSYVTSVWITTLEISNFTIFVYWLNT